MDYTIGPSEFKTLDGDGGTFEGYASIFGNVDSDGDVIEPGAFREIKLNSRGKVLVLDQHQRNFPIGSAVVSQDSKGLAFRGELVMESANARTCHALMKSGCLEGMSIGFDILPDGAQRMASGARHLKALRLWEISPVVFGANQLAGVTHVKQAITVPQFQTLREIEAWLRGSVGLTKSGALDFIGRFKAALIEPREVEKQEAEKMAACLAALKSTSVAPRARL
jgi:uncharacterized protein